MPPPGTANPFRLFLGWRSQHQAAPATTKTRKQKRQINDKKTVKLPGKLPISPPSP
jgi:hypothetical protein